MKTGKRVESRRSRVESQVLIAALIAFCGCANQSGVLPSTLDPRLSTLRQSAAAVITPPPTPGMNFVFTYSTPMTNAVLQSSTDLVHWTTRTDVWLTTNDDNTIWWNLKSDPAKSHEFYRVAGQAVPLNSPAFAKATADKQPSTNPRP